MSKLELVRLLTEGKLLLSILLLQGNGQISLSSDEAERFAKLNTASLRLTSHYNK